MTSLFGYFCERCFFITCQYVDLCYGIDPSPFAIETAMKTREKYRKIFLYELINFCIINFFLAHTYNVQLNICANNDDFKNLLTSIENNRKKNASLTCVFGPVRNDLERQYLRQSSKTSHMYLCWL